MIGKEND